MYRVEMNLDSYGIAYKVQLLLIILHNYLQENDTVGWFYFNSAVKSIQTMIWLILTIDFDQNE